MCLDFVTQNKIKVWLQNHRYHEEPNNHRVWSSLSVKNCSKH